MGLKEQLPIQLDCFLIQYGFFQPEDMPEFVPYRFKHKTKQVMVVSTTPERRTAKSHAPVFIAQPTEQYVAWKPTHQGEEPPF